METFKKPSIKVPQGFELFFNTLTGNWALRPVKGYSTIYYKKDAFVPKKKEEGPKIFSEEEVEEKSTRNSNLTKAKKAKNDEFYTRLADIVDELKHYEEHFKGKVIYCPCDKLFNEGQSNFGRYFICKFHNLGVKKLICTQWNPNGVGVVKEYDFEKCGIKWEYNGEKEDGEYVDESDIDTYFLKGNGSFDSDECKEIMRNCDIVVTNPPFSLFRQFVEQIMTMGKKFIIVGNHSAITYKEIFPYLKDNKMWLGYKPLGGEMYFHITDEYKEEIVKTKKEGTGWVEIGGEVMARVTQACWFTNLEHSKRRAFIGLTKKYNPTDYPKYDNYDAIEVGRVEDIPKDYDGVIGVPITYFGKHNPNQFEVIGITEKSEDMKSLYIEGNEKYDRPYLNGKRMTARLLIRKVKELPTEEKVKPLMKS